MKFVCLGYAAEDTWESISKNEQDAAIEECFAYDCELQQKGHWLDGGQALQSSRSTKTLRWKEGKVLVTDGPFTETKEQLGGFGVLEARDMDHAVELMSKHACLRLGPLEIRPVNEESLRRQMAAVAKRSGAQATEASQQSTKNFACLGYIDEQPWCSTPQADFGAMMDEVIRFDETLQKNGTWISGVGLQNAGNAKTLRSHGGKVIVTDGPFAETKEHLGGVVVNRFTSLQDAVAVLSTHPALRYGIAIEIRPIDEEMNARWEARKNLVATH